MEQPRCPNCHQIIVSRKFAACTSCGFVLPANLVMTDEEKKNTEEIDEHSAAHAQDELKFITAMRSQDIRGSGWGMI